MMKKITYLFHSLIFLALAVLTGCKDEVWDKGTSEQEDGYGTLYFTGLNVEVVNLDAVDSRNVPDVGQFIVELFKDGELSMSFPYVSTMPESVSLPVGTYTVKARSGDVLPAAWYSPYFEGQTTVTVKEGEETSVQTIYCYLANIEVTVAIEGKLREMISDESYVNVAYRNEEDVSNILTYGLTAIDESHEGYFEYIEDGETLVAVLHGSIDGEEIRKEFTCVNLSAGQHCVITFSIKESGDDSGNDDQGDDNSGDDDQGDDNSGDDDQSGDDSGDDNQGDDDPGVDETIGSFSLQNGLTVDVTVKITDLTYILQGEEDPVLDGILRPGDPGYTGDEEPGKTTPSYPWGSADDDNQGDDNSGDDNSGDDNQGGDDSGNDDQSGGDDQNGDDDQDGDDPSGNDPVVVYTVGFQSAYLDLSGTNPADDYGTGSGQKPAVIEIYATAGIAHIYVEIDSPALPPSELAGIGLTSEFDLAYPGNYERALNDLGFVTGSDVIGKTTIEFDVTEFIPLLVLLNTPGTHHFIITVVDQQETPLSKTLDLRFVTE